MIEGILGLARDAPQIPIWHITEGDAINYLTPKEEADREKRKTTRLSAIEFKLIEGAVHVIQACIDAKKLSPNQQKILQERGLLPTRDGPEAPWKEALFWRDAVPTIGGLPPPRIVDQRLLDLRMLREGGLKLSKFKLKDYLLRFNFTPASAVDRQQFF